MPKRYQIELTEQEKQKLEGWTKNPPRAYLRERARATLKVAQGKTLEATAQELRVRVHRNAVSEWVKRFLVERLEGLKIKVGRGRKPIFPLIGEEEAKNQVEYLLHHSPRKYGLSCTRWRLQDVGRALRWLEGCSEPGIYKVLKRLGFSCKRAMNFIHSPDPNYHNKWKAILQAFTDAVHHPGEVVILFLDEFSYYRQPTLACAYHPTGTSLPYAFQVARANTRTRLVATLNGLTGKVTYLQRSKIGSLALQDFYELVRAAYPEAQRIYVVQDNWPVHKLPEVLQAMQDNHLTPLFLPTYASWLNPIEKLWRWLKQDILHLHTLANQLETLREHVRTFLDQFALGSDPLLCYVGLLLD